MMKLYVLSCNWLISVTVGNAGTSRHILVTSRHILELVDIYWTNPPFYNRLLPSLCNRKLLAMHGCKLFGRIIIIILSSINPSIFLNKIQTLTPLLF